MRSGLGVNLKDVTVFNRGREKGRWISPLTSLLPPHSLYLSQRITQARATKAGSSNWACVGFLKEPTRAPGATEAASSCASTWAAAAGPAPAPTVAWPRTALPASATRVICSTLRGPYWKAFTFQMKVTSIRPSSRLKIRLFLRAPSPWPLTTARQQPGPTASFTATPTSETSRWLTTTGRGDLLSWKVCLCFYCALQRCTSRLIPFKVHLNICSTCRILFQCATILRSTW